MIAIPELGSPLSSHPLRVAAIRFLNPAPLMWDFEHEPGKSQLATNYHLQWMMPAQCADRLVLPADHPDACDLGLIPIATLATNPTLRVVPGVSGQPGCAIASKGHIRSLILVRRASQPLSAIRTIAADTSSRSTLAYTQILFHLWHNPQARFLQHPPQLDQMLEAADAAILIGDPALYALQERQNLEERTGQELIYHDLAEEWTALLGVPWISAVWAIRSSALATHSLHSIAADLNASKNHGLANIPALVEEWSRKLPLPADSIHDYLSSNIYYHLDEACLTGMQTFFTLAAEYNILPAYELSL
ncbi:MAG TPA: menaquinone biosynthesis protein [Acidobacteriaceae bacterium]|nr:menaquinone biosynthesis protein [Acidobacteriaceae bacterium]